MAITSLHKILTGFYNDDHQQNVISRTYIYSKPTGCAAAVAVSVIANHKIQGKLFLSK
jgi:hypothetical protein